MPRSEKTELEIQRTKTELQFRRDRMKFLETEERSMEWKQDFDIYVQLLDRLLGITKDGNIK